MGQLHSIRSYNSSFDDRLDAPPPPPAHHQTDYVNPPEEGRGMLKGLIGIC